MNGFYFTTNGWTDYLYWQEQDKKTLRKINILIKDISRNGYSSIGKSEALSGNLSGLHSVHIDAKNRIVFKIVDDKLEIHACRSHYGDK